MYAIISLPIKFIKFEINVVLQSVLEMKLIIKTKIDNIQDEALLNRINDLAN